MKGFSNEFRKSVGMVLSALGLSATLAACSVDAGATSPVTDIPPPPTAAKAMANEGTWATNCYYSQGNYIRETMVLKDNTVSVKADVYYYSSCNGTPIASTKLDGTLYRVGTSFWVAGGHDVEVTMTQPDGTTKMQRTVFLIESGLLYTSDSDTTTSSQWPIAVDRSHPYHYIGG